MLALHQCAKEDARQHPSIITRWRLQSMLGRSCIPEIGNWSIRYRKKPAVFVSLESGSHRIRRVRKALRGGSLSQDDKIPCLIIQCCFATGYARTLQHSVFISTLTCFEAASVRYQDCGQFSAFVSLWRCCRRREMKGRIAKQRPDCRRIAKSCCFNIGVVAINQL